MSILHTVNKSPFERNALESCLMHLADNASVLLIEDGVVGAMQGTTMNDKIKDRVYAEVKRSSE